MYDWLVYTTLRKPQNILIHSLCIKTKPSWISFSRSASESGRNRWKSYLPLCNSSTNYKWNSYYSKNHCYKNGNKTPSRPLTTSWSYENKSWQFISSITVTCRSKLTGMQAPHICITRLPSRMYNYVIIYDYLYNTILRTMYYTHGVDHFHK